MWCSKTIAPVHASRYSCVRYSWWSSPINSPVPCASLISTGCAPLIRQRLRRPWMWYEVTAAACTGFSPAMRPTHSVQPCSSHWCFATRPQAYCSSFGRHSQVLPAYIWAYISLWILHAEPCSACFRAQFSGLRATGYAALPPSIQTTVHPCVQHLDMSNLTFRQYIS